MSLDRQDRAFRSLSPVGKCTVHKKVEKTKSLIAEKRRELEEWTIANQNLQLACEHLKKEILTMQINDLRRQIFLFQRSRSATF